MKGGSLEELRKGLAETLQMPLRERRKAGRSIGHIAWLLSQKDALKEIPDIELAIRALALGASVHTYPQRYQIARAKLMAKRRDLLGLPEPEIAFETSKTIDVEMGGILVADREMNVTELLETNPMHKALNATRTFFVGLGGDGMVKLRLRIHKSGPCEPQQAEFRKLRKATSVAGFYANDGRFIVHGGGKRRIEATSHLADMAVCAFGLGLGRKPECLIIVAPGTSSNEPLQETPELEL